VASPPASARELMPFSHLNKVHCFFTFFSITQGYFFVLFFLNSEGKTLTLSPINENARKVGAQQTKQ
jgi:hypothetical protein